MPLLRDNMIVEYNSKYDDDIKSLLIELQKHIVAIDKEGYNILTKEYWASLNLPVDGWTGTLRSVSCHRATR